METRKSEYLYFIIYRDLDTKENLVDHLKIFYPVLNNYNIQLYKSTKLIKGFKHFVVKESGKRVVVPDCDSLTIYINKDMRIKLPQLKTLIYQSSGRFINQETFFSYTNLKLPLSLTKLVFDGPFLDIVIDYWKPTMDLLGYLKNLTVLLADFDQKVHTAKWLFELIQKLPNLRSLGRLGRVDKEFWRMFTKYKSRIENVQVGMIKYPIQHQKPPNPLFLQNLSFGLLWAFPLLKELQIYMAFDTQVDALVEIVKELKQGLPDGNVVLKKVELYQISDVDLFRNQTWNYIAKNHAGYPIDIFITDDTTVNGTIGRKSKQF
ncbi:hypothetical protein HDV01_007894 [Terramyces sp. JEL0728]|nr:hypothetical protein HDV01_007894 [Terramyces sp. JEL0728]